MKLNNLRLTWYMRGGISYEDVMNMSRDEIEMIHKIIDDNMETTKKSQLPFF